MDYLLDTNIVVYFLRNRKNIQSRFLQAGLPHLFISEMTVGELLYGAHCSDSPAENVEAVRLFCQYVKVLPAKNIWHEFTVQKSMLRRKGMMVEDADLIIGATAIVHGMTLVSENVKHLGRLEGVMLENWAG